jgi:hypothetical protein
MENNQNHPVTIAIESAVTAREIKRMREIAYCAGLFDGDGCIFVSYQNVPGRKNPTYRLCLCLVQNDRSTVENFRRVLNIPSTLIEVTRTKHHNRQVFDLRYYGEHATAALRLMHDDLVRKRWESMVAQQFWVDGMMGVLPGPKGLPEGIWRIRAQYRRKLSKLK